MAQSPRRRPLISLMLATLLAALAQPGLAAPGTLVLTNAKIHTVNPAAPTAE